MYLDGEGGTGKSEVIKAVTEMFQILNKSELLKKVAYTGAAASNIDGVTLAYLFDQQRNERKEEEETTVSMGRLDRLTKKIGEKIEMIIVDEVSMTSPSKWATWDGHLRQVAKAHKIFGGVHMLFVGDFLQYPPVGQHALFESISNNTISKM